MKLTEQQLLRIFPNARLVAGVFVAALQRAMDEREIDTPARRAAFLAQVGHESSQLTRLVENLNYSAQGLAATWPSRYLGPDGQPNALALRLARNPQAIADNTYATRNGNGDEASGDGWRFRGRGLLQITGRATTGWSARPSASRWKPSPGAWSSPCRRPAAPPGGGPVTGSTSWPTVVSSLPSPAASTAA